MNILPPPDTTGTTGFNAGGAQSFQDRTRFTPDKDYVAKAQAEAKLKDDQQFVSLVEALQPAFTSSMSDLDIQRRLNAIWNWWKDEDWKEPA